MSRKGNQATLALYILSVKQRDQRAAAIKAKEANERIGMLMKAKRTKQPGTQEAFAERLGMKLKDMKALEAGQAMWTEKLIRRYAETLSE